MGASSGFGTLCALLVEAKHTDSPEPTTSSNFVRQPADSRGSLHLICGNTRREICQYAI